MIIVKRINQNNHYDMQKAFIELKAICPYYDDIKREIFYQCSTYVSVSENNRILGMISARRVLEVPEIESLFDYHPQPNNMAYHIEVLHFDPSLDRGQKVKLIKEGIRDKHDSFIVFIPKCEEVFKDEEVFNNLGFRKNILPNDISCFIRKPIHKKDHWWF